ncbi:unnamed protein product [Candida verbasci]|uniref:Uncharacterized protein n=1 Tax=Candida verbasci TaxID=1227364 RepID=A0A9W4TW55_9ASCO|nr:unnamed protein product [Candida verbasci]
MSLKKNIFTPLKLNILEIPLNSKPNPLIHFTPDQLKSLPWKDYLYLNEIPYGSNEEREIICYNVINLIYDEILNSPSLADGLFNGLKDETMKKYVIEALTEKFKGDKIKLSIFQFISRPNDIETRDLFFEIFKQIIWMNETNETRCDLLFNYFEKICKTSYVNSELFYSFVEFNKLIYNSQEPYKAMFLLNCMVEKFELLCQKSTSKSKINQSLSLIIKSVLKLVLKYHGSENGTQILKYMIKENFSIDFEVYAILLSSLRKEGNNEQFISVLNNLDLKSITHEQKMFLSNEILLLIKNKFPTSPKVFIGYIGALFNDGLEILNELRLLNLPSSDKITHYDNIQLANIDSNLTVPHLDSFGISNMYEHNIDSTKSFHEIALHINNTLEELDKIYNIIGYSNSETLSKKNEIFNIIQDTIVNFSTNLNRERNNIENECEWLRQQIQIILSMINDIKGDKNLNLIEKGLVFKNQSLYEDGYKEQILTRMTNQLQGECGDYDIHIDKDLSIERQYEYLMNNIPVLSLLQQRNKLNLIFLQVLKSFIKMFKQLNYVNLQYIELIEVIGYDNSLDPKLNMLPAKPDAIYHQEIIKEFESVTKTIKSSNHSYILASPIKNVSPKRNQAVDLDENFIQLRDLNYQLIKIIRGLKITKITPEFLLHVNSELEKGKSITEKRKQQVLKILENCFEFISLLNLNNDQILELQKSNSQEEAILDLETLEAIRNEPHQFGLNDDHINFLQVFQNLLKTTYEDKKAKWHELYNTCTLLWKKLGENSEYIENFLTRNNSISDLSILNFKMELNKLYIRRSEFIESFINDARIEIEKLWDRMYYSIEMRQDFEFFNYNPENDDDETNKEVVLNKHELELKRLKEEFNEKKPVFELYNELNDLLKDQQFLIESSKDSSRLLSKNSCKILLNEEKIRKKINKNLPKTIENLKNEVTKYNNLALSKNQKKLTINGEDFFEKVCFMSSELHKVKNISSSKVRADVKSPNKLRFTRPTSSPERKSPTKSFSRIQKEANIKKVIPKRQTIPSSKFNSSISIHESPIQASRMNSFRNKPPEVLLQPLNSPLKPLNHDKPLFQNSKQHTQNSFDKENMDSSLFDLSPIKLSKFQDEVSNVDTSTLIGDDYLNWRDEKIKQLNN